MANEYRLGNSVTVRLNDGRIVEGKIKAIIRAKDGIRLQVDYGHEETALIHETQVRKE
jgi:hypothetical protein